MYDHTTPPMLEGKAHRSKGHETFEGSCNLKGTNTANTSFSGVDEKAIVTTRAFEPGMEKSHSRTSIKNGATKCIESDVHKNACKNGTPVTNSDEGDEPRPAKSIDGEK